MGGVVSAEKAGSERRVVPSPGFALNSKEAVEALGSGKAAAGFTLLHQHRELLVLCSPHDTGSSVRERAGAKAD